MFAELARAFALCLGVLFTLSATHKVLVVLDGRQAAEPLIRAMRWKPAVAATVLMTAAILEAVVAVLLVAAPSAGMAGAALVLAIYAVELRRLAPREDCNCFGSLLRSRTRRAAIARNVVLAAAATMLAAAHAGGVVEPAPLTAGVVALTLLLAAGPIAAELLPRLLIHARPEA